MEANQLTVTLTNGLVMPKFGLGTYLSENEAQMTNLIRSAFDAGYRLIDTARYYRNEKFIGNALKTIFSEGKYKRSDIFIATKIFPHANEKVEDVVREQLRDLQIDQIDLLYLHWPMTSPQPAENGKKHLRYTHKPVHKVWAELEAVYDVGLAKGLAVSNLNAMMIVDLLSYCRVRPLVNQIELHAFNQQHHLVEFLKREEVYPVAYSPLAKYNSIIENESLKEIASKNHATVPQVLLAYLLSRGISVIPKTEKPERLAENFKSLSLKLSEDDLTVLKTLNKDLRVVGDPSQFDHPFFQGVPLFY